MDIESHCRKEVVELHEFFQQWFTGELPQTDEAFDRFVSVMAESFHIVSPAGRIMQRDPILEAVHDSARGRGSVLFGLVSRPGRNVTTVLSPDPSNRRRTVDAVGEARRAEPGES